MGQFAGVGSAKMSESQPHLTEGKYRLRIERCILKRLFKGGNAFIAEFTVVSSSDTVACPIGALRGWLQKMEPAEVSLGSLKEFGSAVLGVDPRDSAKVKADIEPVIEDAMDLATGPDNFWKGKLVDVEVRIINTKPTVQYPQGHPFARHTWTPAPQA